MKNSINGGNNKEEPNTAPQADRWYTFSLGSSFKDHQPSPKFCTLRYEFKPASIDMSQPGLMHKNKENKVSVEFQNNQPGKPKVTFEGSSEDYKENDAVLFFDGETFRLEKLHKAVKRLRHVRQPGESTAVAAAAASAGLAGPVGVVAAEAISPPSGKAVTAAKGLNLNKSGTFNPVSVEVERIDIGGPENSGVKGITEKIFGAPSHPDPFFASPESKNDNLDEQLDIVDDDDGFASRSKENVLEKTFTGIDINVPHQMDTDEEIADVDLNDDDADTVCNAADVLRAQVNAEGRGEPTSSSSGSSGSESSESSSRSGSGSGSGSSSSSDSDSSDGDSVNSI